MGRRKSEETDSLELLLDTVSNAFGGIMFLAILLSMLLKLSFKAEPQPTPDSDRTISLAMQAEQLDALLNELATLNSAATLLEASREKLVDPATAETYVKVLALRQKQTEQEKAIAKEIAATASTQAELERVLQELAAQEENARKLESEVTAKNKEIHAQKVRSAQSVIPPHARATTKIEVTVIVRFGRIYLKHDWSADGLTRSANLRDFVVIEEDDKSLTLTPIPTRGIAINDTPEFKSSLQSLLRAHRPSERYVCVAIWEDSFGRYQVLKKTLMQLGYDIRLIPVNRGGEIYEGTNVIPQVQ